MAKRPESSNAVRQCHSVKSCVNGEPSDKNPGQGKVTLRVFQAMRRIPQCGRYLSDLKRKSFLNMASSSVTLFYDKLQARLQSFFPSKLK